ncbi:SPOR domain-containing protein [Reinekea blandensis]|nr:SPOR domain-containing protein [Reinekea blandensis]
MSVALLTCVQVAATDEQLSLYAVTTPRLPQYSGLGLEIATNPLPRLSLASSLELSDPFEASVVRIGAQARLRFSADLNTHWYPLLGLTWSSNQSNWRGQLGAGFERRIGTGTGFYSELLWGSEPVDQQLRIGLRFWLLRMDSLDRRMQRAEPKGAVYQGGPIDQAAIQTMKIPALPDQQDPPEQPVQNNAVSSSETVLPTEIPTAVSQPSLVEGWYVQLGVFRQQESVARLEQDPRLSAQREQQVVWFDNELNVHRFLLGPFPKARAVALQSQLKNAGLDSILYDGVR